MFGKILKWLRSLFASKDRSASSNKDVLTKGSLRRDRYQQEEEDTKEDPVRDLELEEAIIHVAQEFEDEPRFKEAAKEVARKLEFDRALLLTNYFHKNPPEPEALHTKTAKYGIFGVWMGICQDAIMEILYNYKEQAIPVLNKIGFGVYDWTQSKAIDVLCQLANEGIHTRETIQNFREQVPNFRIEAIENAVLSFSRISNQPEVPQIIFDLYEKGVFGRYVIVECLSILALNYPDEVKTKLDMIREVAIGEREIDYPSIFGNQDVSDEEETLDGEAEEGNPKYQDPTQIQAAVLYYSLDDQDPEINQIVDYWEQHAKHESDRNHITEVKRKKRLS
jgi:hypothetical protein